MPATLLHELTGEIERVETPFNTVVARQRGQWVDLDVEGATFASWHPRYRLTGYSWDGISAAVALLPRPARSVLLLGLGGGTCLHQLRAFLPDARLVSVEIDPEIVALARRHMALDAVDVEVHIEDADAYLRRGRERFDAVLDDLYLTGPEDVVRAGVPAGERLELLRRRTQPAGLVAANLIVDEGHEAIRRQARRAFRESFDEVRVVRPPRGLNEILVGGRRLGDRQSVRRLSPAFPEEHDRKLWERISVRALR